MAGRSSRARSGLSVSNLMDPSRYYGICKRFRRACAGHHGPATRSETPWGSTSWHKPCLCGWQLHVDIIPSSLANTDPVATRLCDDRHPGNGIGPVAESFGYRSSARTTRNMVAPFPASRRRSCSRMARPPRAPVSPDEAGAAPEAAWFVPMIAAIPAGAAPTELAPACEQNKTRPPRSDEFA